MNNSSNDQMPRVLMLSGGLGAGGKERQLINLLKYLKESGKYLVYVAVANPGGMREQEAALYAQEIFPIDRLISIDLITPLINLCRIVRQNNIRLIHSWGSGIWDLVGMIAAKLCGIAFVHGGIRSAPPNLKFGHYLSRWAAKFADVVVANSFAGLRAFKVNNRSKAQVIYNGVNELLFDVNTEVILNTLCMVSNFRSEKDHKTLLSAMPDIIKQIPDVKLYLVGQDAGTLEDVRSRINQLGLNEKIVLLSDCLEPQYVMAKCQIGILTTFGEGFSNVILEYMALSKPVIATDVGGNPELVIHETTGYLVPLNAPSELAERVIELLNDPVKMIAMGKAGHELVVKHFTIEKMGSLYEEIYQSLIGGNN